ncbi:MAG: DUF2085 domain-containing protein [Cyclonatronaceae bacterium]
MNPSTPIPNQREQSGTPRKRKPSLQPLPWAIVFCITLFFLVVAWSPPFTYSTMSEWYESWQKLLFSRVCHQQIDRTFHLQGIPLAVCSRCTGIYTALFVAIAFFSYFSTLVISAKRYIVPIFALTSLALVLDGVSNLFQLWHTPDAIRLVTGVLWGLSVGMLLVYALVEYRELNNGG